MKLPARHLRGPFALVAGAVLVVAATAAAAAVVSHRDRAPQPRTRAALAVPAAAPYLYVGMGDPPNPANVMAATGVRAFTLAFVLSNGGCEPAWNGTRPLNGGDKTTVDRIRAAHGEVIPSIGGASGRKLGEACPDAASLAAAYQKVVDAYGLKAIDVDIESTEFTNPATQDKVLRALKTVKANNPGISTILTFPTSTTGPNRWGQRLVRRAAELDAGVDVFTIMPFDFGGRGADMGDLSVRASDALHALLKSAFRISDDAAYARQGISSMNGKTDQNETVGTGDFQRMLGYARRHHLARFTFWSVNRDRPCSGGSTASSCGGVDEKSLAFTRIVAAYKG